MDDREKQKEEILRQLGFIKDEWGNLFKDGEFVRSVGSDSKRDNYIIKTLLEIKNKLK